MSSTEAVLHSLSAFFIVLFLTLNSVISGALSLGDCASIEEGGFLKGYALDRRLSFASAAFVSKYEDQQVSTQVVVPSGIASSIDNAGSSTLWGVEFESQARMTANLTGTVALGYIHAEYDTFSRFVPAGAPNPLIAAQPRKRCLTAENSKPGFWSAQKLKSTKVIATAAAKFGATPTSHRPVDPRGRPWSLTQ